jgi:hypothetical protein
MTLGGAYYTPIGAVRLASALLGWDAATLAWLEARTEQMPQAGAPSPTYTTQRAVSHCYLERALDVRASCCETWALRERREGPRVLQWVHVGWSIDDGSRDGSGSGGTAVRIADLAAGVGACVLLHAPHASVIARDPADQARLADLAREALDVFEDGVMHDLPLPYARDAVLRGFAEVCAGFDPAFADAAAWPWPTHEVKAVRARSGEQVGRQVKLRVEAPDGATRGFTLTEVTPMPCATATPSSVWVALAAEGLVGRCMVEMNLQEIKAPRRPSLRATVRVRGPRREVEAVCASLRGGAHGPA